jgi:exosome complex RNA-binding protein Rrp4
MVEDTIQNYSNSVITIAELKRALPKQVNHNTLMTILEYLEKSNKIAVGLRGITWIKNDNKNLRNVAIHGLEL